MNSPIKFISILLVVLLQIVLIYSQIWTHDLSTAANREAVILPFILAELFFGLPSLLLIKKYLFPNQEDERTLRIRNKCFEIQNLILYVLIVALFLTDNRILVFGFALLPIFFEIIYLIAVKILPVTEE